MNDNSRCACVKNKYLINSNNSKKGGQSNKLHTNKTNIVSTHISKEVASFAMRFFSLYKIRMELSCVLFFSFSKE